MARKPPVECPVCREPTDADEQLEDHLLANHTKRKLAMFIVAEAALLIDDDAK
ncbi:hypothetical protein [Haloterrigena sp. H1]|uniref:hypothetical protein n=1 Tax=Haloterrigena sp. H1 TaxID=2552943 RepID=UPI00148725C9|nr:hypothetical protein [Haloterrigena sp. H1]